MMSGHNELVWIEQKYPRLAGMKAYILCNKYFLNKNVYLLLFNKYLLFLQYNFKL